MASITISPEFLNSTTTTIQYRCLSPGNVSQSALLSGSGNSGSSQNSAQAVFSIMKGTMPASFATTTYAAYSANILVSFSTPLATNGNAGDFAPSSVLNTPAVITTNYKAATAAGTATWFWWVTRTTFSGGLIGDTLIQQIAGTVGTIGSGADLEIASTTISIGQQLRVFNFRYTFPSSFVF